MVVCFEQSLKKLNNEKREKEVRKEEISEIQDALVEIASIVAVGFDTENSGEDGGNSG